MIIKKAINHLKSQIFDQKTMNSSYFSKQLLMPLILLSTIKNYISKCFTEQDLFIIPQSVKEYCRKDQKNKISLVLDLDQTLVYSRSQNIPNCHKNYIIVKSADNEQFIVQLRPHLSQFLTATSSIFNIYVYTAGRKNYADAVIDAIDPKGLIKKRFYRDSCVPFKGSFVKNLKKLGLQKEKRLFLVDDNADSIRLNAPNSQIIKGFEGDQDDKQLVYTFRKLLQLYEATPKNQI